MSASAEETPTPISKGREAIDQIPCGPDCILPTLQNQEWENVPLGGTRGTRPGIRWKGSLIVPNVFTHSHRQGFFLRRSFALYLESMQRLRTTSFHHIVPVEKICTCSTKMKFLDNHLLLGNRSIFTPPQHQHDCWADHHTAEEFVSILQPLLFEVRALHRVGVIHTDVTAFNILVSAENHATLIDLFSCVTIDSLGPRWLPQRWKEWIAERLEQRQIHTYLLKPPQEHWGVRLSLDPHTYALTMYPL